MSIHLPILTVFSVLSLDGVVFPLVSSGFGEGKKGLEMGWDGKFSFFFFVFLFFFDTDWIWHRWIIDVGEKGGGFRGLIFSP